MKKYVIVILILTAFIAVGYAGFNNNIPEPQSASLYDRLGGEEGISQIVDEAVKMHGENPVIAKRFLPYNQEPERLAKIKHHTVMFFSAGSGGIQKYTGREMPTAHQGMNISAAEYMAVVNDIMLVLDNRNIDEESKKDVLAILWSLKGHIMAK